MQRFLRLTIIFLVTLLFVQWLGIGTKSALPQDDLVMLSKGKYVLGEAFQIEVANQSAGAISWTNPCPKSPLKVELYQNGEWVYQEADTEKITCDTEIIALEAGEKKTIDLAPWNQALFAANGKYRLSLETIVDEKTKIYIHEVEITPPSLLRRIWNFLFYKPILNTLIYFIALFPGHDLGWAVIFLTFLIKLILLAPNQKALKAQKRMQKVQPQLEALKLKYASDQQKLAQETMKLWKQYKVNPMDSCLPILVQFPVLIALFYVVKNGLAYVNPELLYSGLKNIDLLAINTNFLGIIELTKVNFIALPIVVGLLQFGQMKLSFAGMSKGKEGKPLPAMNRAMLYVLPVMIGVFTARLPAAVGFYWGASTLFGVGQQFIVNRSKD